MTIQEFIDTIPASYFSVILRKLSAQIKIEENGCWLWTGCVNKYGYGVINIKNKSYRIHRLMYLIVTGFVNDDLDLDHTCHKPVSCPGGIMCQHRRCCNPSHLDPVTNIENLHRGHGNSASLVARKSRQCCKNGHLYTAENTAISNGARVCRKCQRERAEQKRRMAGARHVPRHDARGRLGDQIRILRAGGMLLSELADKFDISVSEVSRICHQLPTK